MIITRNYNVINICHYDLNIFSSFSFLHNNVTKFSKTTYTLLLELMQSFLQFAVHQLESRIWALKEDHMRATASGSSFYGFT